MFGVHFFHWGLNFILLKYPYVIYFNKYQNISFFVIVYFLCFILKFLEYIDIINNKDAPVGKTVIFADSVAALQRIETPTEKLDQYL